MGRPGGVTFIAILDFLGAAICILLAITMMVGGGFVANLMSQSGGQGAGAGAGLFAGLGVVMGVVFLVIAIIPILVGWGLWKLKEWARIVSIVFAVLGIVSNLFRLLTVLVHFNVILLGITLCLLALNAWIIWYLLQPNVKAAFQGAKAAAAV